MQEIVNTNLQAYEKDAEVVDEAWEMVEQNGVELSSCADLGTNSDDEESPNRTDDDQQEKADNLEDPAIPDLDASLNQSSMPLPHPSNVCVEQTLSGISKATALKILRSMNPKQRKIFNHLRQWAVDKVQGQNPKQFLIFLTGGAGTGKSHIINGFKYEAARLFARQCDSADDITVLLCAFTGTAAFNIGGQTLHSAFSIYGDIKQEKQYKPLGDDSLTKLRQKYRHLKVVIIDEISMVGQKMLNFVSERLKQIKQCQAPFGNISVLAVGDFFQIPVGDINLYKQSKINFGAALWDKFKLFELEDIMRQKEDLAFAKVLNEI